MKKTTRSFLLAILLLCTIFAMTIMVSATGEDTSVTVVDWGYVMQYDTYDAADSTNNVKNTDGTTNDVKWTLTSDGVLTISSTNSSEFKMNPSAGWAEDVDYKARIPWYSEHKEDITSIVVEESITYVNAANAFGYLPNVTSITFKASSVKLNGSMIFNNLPKLTSLKFEGEDYSDYEGQNIIDLRHFTNKSNQAFEASSQAMAVTVLMPYTNASPMDETKVFNTDTVVTFKVLRDSPAATTAGNIQANSNNYDNYIAAGNRTPYTKSVTIEYYTGLTVEGTTGYTAWTLDVDSGALSIFMDPNPAGDDWPQFEPHNDAWQSFKTTWGSYVKNITVEPLSKIWTKASPFDGMKNVETIRFVKPDQRFQNSISEGGLFTGLTSLNAVVFGDGERVPGVADLSKATNTSDSPDKWLYYAFSGCESLKEIILPTTDTLTTVPASAFNGCTGLTKVTIGDNIQTIAEGTFDAWINSTEGYSALTVNFTEEGSALGNSLTSEGFLTVSVPAVATSGQIDGVEGDGDTNDLTWDFDAESGTLTIEGESTDIVWPADAFIGYNSETYKAELEDLPWYEFMDDIKHIVVNAPITALQPYTFAGLKNLETVEFPADLKSLGNNAFDNADSLVSIKTTGVEIPEECGKVIDLRNITTSSYQVFEGAFDNVTPTIWLGKDGSAIGNNNFATGCAGVKFVVYPGSVGEEVVYNMINNPARNSSGTSLICPKITYSYYTTNEDADLAKWTEILSGVSTKETTYGIANWDLDIDTGVVTVTVTTGTNGTSTGDCTLSSDCSVWSTFVKTFKYAIKEFHFLTGAKLNAGSTINGLPELTTIIFNGNRMQGSTTFKNNPKLTTLGTSSNVVDGVINLSGWNEVNNSHTHSALYKGMFEGCTSITKVILPANFSASANFGIISIGANAFKGCTGLKEIVIPDGCSILMTDVTCTYKNSSTDHTGNVYNGTIDSTAFDGCGTIAVICEDADFDIDTFMALHDGFYLISNSADGLTKGVVFDGWQVRLNSYTNSKGLKVTNGLRGVFYFDNDIIDANTNWTLVEYGALLSTAANKASAVVSYDKTTGEVTSDCKWKFAIVNADGVNGKVLSKSAVAKIEGADPNDTYFVVSVVNYTNNYRTDIYMTGYEVWVNKETGAVVISYSDYSNEKYVDTNIYEISLNMYKNGFVNANNDKENIVWDTLVNGGALELTKDVDYVTKDKYCVDENGDQVEAINMLTNEPFGDTFTVANVPMVRQWTENVTNDQGTEDTADDVTVKTLKFGHAGTTYTFLHDPDNEGKYIIVYRDDPDVAGTEIPETSPWGDGYHSQIETSWYPGRGDTYINAVTASRPNPKYTTNIYSSANYAIIDYDVTGTTGESFKGSGVNTYMYNETFTKLGRGSFQGTSAITTMFPAGTTPVTGRIEISSLTTVGSGYVFNGSKNIVELHLPTNITIGRQFAQDTSSLTTVWLGGENIDINEDGEIGVNEWTTREEGVINLSNAENESFTKIGNEENADEKSFSKVKATELWLPASVQEIMSSSFTDSSLETIYHYGISEPVEAIQSYATSNGYDYWWDGAIESAVGYSGIIVD
ncbi:MAG: leucine-rich repeat protein [Clostridia bacterium]|nr:leucine-rich repeat protein [Clostridia bacterium]